MARIYYRNNQRRLRLVSEFERMYRPNYAIRWCASVPFPSYLLQHAFISFQPEQLHLCRFLIADASRMLQQQPKRARNIQLYRGMKLPSQLVDQLEMHTDKLMCTSGFFTCTKSRTVALELASAPGYRSDLSSVLFKVDCDPSTNLADVSTEGRPPMVIFDTATAFRIICVNRGATSIVKMKTVPDEGKKLALHYLEDHKEKTVQELLDELSIPPKSSSPPPSQPSQSSLSPNKSVEK